MAPIKKPEVDYVKKYETVVNSGQSALRALLTMNGGAIIAFLTFIGNKGRLPPQSIPLFAGALRLFIGGTFFTVLAFGMIFLSNCLSLRGKDKWSDWSFGFTVVCGIGSTACFFFASWHAADAVQLLTSGVK